MLIRIPVPGVRYVVEFDSGKIDGIEMPREIADVPGEPGRRELPGPSALILHFATLDDAPKWVDPAETPAPPSAAILLAACEAMAALIREEYGEGPIAEEVFIHTDATPGQRQAIAELDAYWAAVKPQEGRDGP